MKGKLFIAALALLAVAACNKENGKTIDPSVKTGDQYMAVNLKMSGTPTKAWDNTFKEASADEIAVDNVQFLFFNDDTQCADPYTPKEKIEWGAPDHGDSDQKKADAIIVLENPTAIPTSIVAIININEKLDKSVKLSDLSQKTDFTAVEGKFVMTNSVYVENGEVIVGTPVTEENVGKTQDEAKAAPVEIHVERVLAKVELDASAAAQEKKPVDSEGNEITVTIDGFWLDYTNPDAYLVKSLAANALEGNWWIDTPNFRSYWAASATPKEFGRGKFSDASKDAKYVNENTPKAADIATDAASSENHAATQIVFAAHIGDNKTDYVKYLSSYYTVANWKTYVLNTLSNYYTETTAPDVTTQTPGVYDRITANDLVWSDALVNKDADNTTDPVTPKVDVENPSWDGTSEAYAASKYIEDWEAVFTVSCNKALFYKDGTPVKDADNPFKQDSAIDTYDNMLAYKVQYFAKGATYFYAPIRHNDTLMTEATEDAEATPKDGYYGIVRNHLYKVNATKIVGVGTPVANPDRVIIPVKPLDNKSYIAAEIDVLKYKVVTNDYILE